MDANVTSWSKAIELFASLQKRGVTVHAFCLQELMRGPGSLPQMRAQAAAARLHLQASLSVITEKQGLSGGVALGSHWQRGIGLLRQWLHELC